MMLDGRVNANGIASISGRHDCWCDETAGLMFSFVVQLFDWAGLEISPVTLDVLKALPGSHMTSQQMARATVIVALL